MAAEVPSFDDLELIGDDTNDNDDRNVKLEPGEELVGELRFIESNASRYGNDKLHLTRLDDQEYVTWWSNATVSKKLEQKDVEPGDIIGLRKDEDTYTYTDDETGEENEAYGYEVGVFPEGEA